MTRQKWLCIVFVVFIAGISLVNWLTPSTDFSESENRSLQTFPEVNTEKVFSGEFSQEFESYANDQFLLRDGWVGLKTLASLAIGKKDNGRVFFGKDGYLLEMDSVLNQQQLSANAEALGAFMAYAKQQNPALNLAVLMAPTATGVMTEKLPPLAVTYDQAQAIEQVRAAMPEGVVFPDILSALNAHKADDNLYYRTDHHWTTHGAYWAYAELLTRWGMTPLAREDFTVRTVSDAFYGTTYSKANLYTIRPDTVERYDPVTANPCTMKLDGKDTVYDSLYDESFLGKKDKYSYFLGGNHRIYEIDTSVKNGRTLLVLQDSYAHCMIPFLAQHYEKIVVADLRYFLTPVEDLLTEYAVTDVLALYNIETFSTEASIAGMLGYF